MANVSNGLSDDYLAKQRARLEALQRELLGGEESGIAAQRQQQELHGDETHTFEDDAQRMEADVAGQALRDVNERRIGDIQRALEKIAEGTYGFSDESGDPIPQARLDVMPEAILTVAEQGRREAGREAGQ
jgi:DnaK suppressor protein